jgi:hypothetical protein
MYLRTTKRSNKDGSVIEYFQLAHNERDPKTRKPVAKIIHNFGRADQLDRDQLVRLCRSIARVCGLTVTDPLEHQQYTPALSSDLKIQQTLAYGCPLVIEALWERLGLKKELTDIVREKGVCVNYERALLAMTANRLCEPESKLGVWDRCLRSTCLRAAALSSITCTMPWICSTSMLNELKGTSFSKPQTCSTSRSI